MKAKVEILEQCIRIVVTDGDDDSVCRTMGPAHSFAI